MTRRAPAAVLAVEAVTALGAGLDKTLDALLAGRSAVGPVGSFDASGFGDPAAAPLSAPVADPADGGGTRVDTPHGAVLARCAAAVHAAAGGAALPREAIGVYVALGMVDAEPSDLAPAVLASAAENGGGFSLPRFFDEGWRSIHPLWPLRMLGNVAVGQLAADLDLRGDDLVLSSEADAGVAAALEGLEAIRSGAATAALVGGVSERVSPAALARAALRGVPAQVLGEGGAALWLEDEASVAARGVRPLARLAGAGNAFGAEDDGVGPSAATIERAIREALDDAGVAPDRVGLVVVEGVLAAEAEARRAVFGARRSSGPGGALPAVVAPAVAIGHLLAGAPAVACALAVRMLARGAAPSSSGGRARALDAGAAALVIGTGSAGGAGALVLEGA